MLFFADTTFGIAMRFFCSLLVLLSTVFAQESYDQLLRHWDYDKNAPLNFRQQSVCEDHGIGIYEITYSGSVGKRGALAGPNAGRVTASLVLPQGKGPFPAVIYGHWCMPGSEKMNRTEFLDEALVLTQA